MKHLLAAALFVLIAVSPSRAGDLEDGIAAYEAEDYERAHQLLLPLADAGSAEAQYRVGMLYGLAQGVAMDLAIAADWFELAAEQGHARAQFNIARSYYKSLGRPQNLERAFHFIKLSADQCFLQAQGVLANFYWLGSGTSKDKVLAFAWALYSYKRGYELNSAVIAVMPLEMEDDQLERSRILALELETSLGCSMSTEEPSLP